jgi:hypothetical protein
VDQDSGVAVISALASVTVTKHHHRRVDSELKRHTAVLEHLAGRWALAHLETTEYRLHASVLTAQSLSGGMHKASSAQGPATQPHVPSGCAALVQHTVAACMNFNNCSDSARTMQAAVALLRT